MVGGRLALLLEALQPSATQELRLSSCDLTTVDLLHLGTHMHTHYHALYTHLQIQVSLIIFPSAPSCGM